MIVADDGGAAQRDRPTNRHRRRSVANWVHSVSPGRFTAPWKVVPTPNGYRVQDANGVLLAYVYGEARYSAGDDRLTLDEARRIAAGIARQKPKSPPPDGSGNSGCG